MCGGWFTVRSALSMRSIVRACTLSLFFTHIITPNIDMRENGNMQVRNGFTGVLLNTETCVYMDVVDTFKYILFYIPQYNIVQQTINCNGGVYLDGFV